MFSEYSYPIICTDQFAETVAFYEDYFGFVSVFEQNGYCVLSQDGNDKVFLAVADSQSTKLPEKFRKNTTGMVLNIAVGDIKEANKNLYFEGLPVLSDLKESGCGRDHFFVEDPNGILINVVQSISEYSIVRNHDSDDMIVSNQKQKDKVACKA